MSDISALIESAVQGSKEDRRNLYNAFYQQIQSVSQANGQAILPTSTNQAAVSAPLAGSVSASGANGIVTVTITNPTQNVAGNLYNEVSYSTTKGFTSGVTTPPASSSLQYTIPSPGAQFFVRARWSYDKTNFSPYALASLTATDAGLQSSAASANAVPLNQSNYAYVDSQAAGSAAAVRVYGAAGPNNGWVGQKGGAETVFPSATILNVPYGSEGFVSYDGEQYQVSTNLTGAFDDSSTPVGKVSVVGTGAPTLPNIVLLVQGGYVVGIKSSSTFGSGLTQLPTFTITDGSGTGAAIIATGLNAGAITGISITNAGDGNYSSTPTVTAHGGVFSGASGGGTVVGGNGGRLTNV